MSNRPSWDDFLKGLAVYWSQMSTCSRRQVGAVVVKDRMVLGEGFNGIVSGKTHCVDGGCPRGQFSYEDVPAGTDYNDVPCYAIHAEANALYRAGLDAAHGATLYVNAEPCTQCSALIERFGIKGVVVVSNDRG